MCSGIKNSVVWCQYYELRSHLAGLEKVQVDFSI
jgi:hypothetical protein